MARGSPGQLALRKTQKTGQKPPWPTGEKGGTEVVQGPNLQWQTGLPLLVCPPLPLSGLATRTALADNAPLDAAGGRQEDRPAEGASHTARGSPDTGDRPGPLPPRCGWGESELTPLNLSSSLLAKATHPPEGTYNFTSFGGEASKFNDGAPRAGQLLCLSPSLRAFPYPLERQPGLSLLTGLSKIAPLV